MGLMARLTITLSDETHRRLKVQAALEDRTIGDLIEEDLALAREAHLGQVLLGLALALVVPVVTAKFGRRRSACADR